MNLLARFAVVYLLLNSAAHARAEETISKFLTHMPQNSDKRCVGIAGVAESLVEGEKVVGLKISLDRLAQEIYEGFTSDQLVRYPERVQVSGKLRSIDDKTVLNELSSRVANLYKADYYRMNRNSRDRQSLVAAQKDVVRTIKELNRLLEADTDEIVFFCCFGSRVFPDGKISETSHAVLIQAMPHQVYLVYDPNDPGMPVEPMIKESAAGLQVTWQCKYRDQGIETTQSYLIVPQKRFFEALK